MRIPTRALRMTHCKAYPVDKLLRIHNRYVPKGLQRVAVRLLWILSIYHPGVLSMSILLYVYVM